ncbi:MAG TPA: Wzz/FepE/Etk N-terminal domain-containing protein, partial [Oculatellaceae cyanobacterium]
MMKAGQNSQPLPLTKVAQFNESDEGGLNLGQVLGAIRRRVIWVIGVTAVMAAAGGFKALKETPIYQAKFEILTKPLTVESEVVSSVPQTLGNQRGELTGSTKGGVNETKIRVLQSPKVLSPLVEQLKTRYPGVSYDSIAGSLSIKNSDQASDILEVGYQSPDPKLVKDVLALVSKAFLNYSLEERQIDIRRGLKFVEEQLPKLQSRVQTQQERLQRIRQNNNLINPEQTGTQVSGQIATYKNQKLDIQIQIKEAQALYANLQKELAKQPIELAAARVLNESPRYQKIITNLQEIDTQ